MLFVALLLAFGHVQAQTDPLPTWGRPPRRSRVPASGWRSLSRKFIELHGGRIWVKSQFGQGSTFAFTLPVGRED